MMQFLNKPNSDLLNDLHIAIVVKNDLKYSFFIFPVDFGSKFTIYR